MGVRRSTVRWPAWLTVMALFLTGAPPTTPQPRGSVVELPGHVITLPAGAQSIPTPPGAANQIMFVTIVLRRTDEKGFRAFVAAVNDPKSPQFRHYLSQAELTRRFGPPEIAYRTVEQYLVRNGLDVAPVAKENSNWLTLSASGRQHQIGTAFNVHIDYYRLRGGRIFFKNRENPSLPPPVAGLVQAVVGLSNLAVPRPAGQSSFGPPAKTIAAIARAYDFPSNSGVGQTVGLVSFSDYDRKDVVNWLAWTGQPAGHINHLSKVNVIPGTTVGITSDEGEILEDIDTVMGLAPGASVVVFEKAPSSPSGLAMAADFHRMIMAMLRYRGARGASVTIISISWLTCESQNPTSDLTALDSIMALAAARGVSIFSASGDTATVCAPSGQVEVAVPAGIPNGTAVGGTTLSVNGLRNYGSESWWNDPLSGSAGGYGNSLAFTAPSWQPTGTNGRSVPDVSASADPNSGFYYCRHDLDPTNGPGCGLLASGTPVVAWGTSLAAPIWAAATALINERCKRPSGLVAAWVNGVPGGLHHPAGMTPPNADFAHLGFGSFDLARLIAGACSLASLKPDASTLLAAVGDARDWVMYGHDYTNDRYSALAQINTANAPTLAPRWIFHTGVFAPFEATPVVYQGTMYVTTAYDRLWALDAATGRSIWKYDPRVSMALLCCGPVNRGVALAYRTVYMATLDARLIAVDAATGQVLWQQQIVNPALGYSETMAPVVYRGKVIVGISGAEFGIRGFVTAYDAFTGELRWRWYTIPSSGWEGTWAATTPEGDPLHRDIGAEKAAWAAHRDAWKHGGGSMWMTPAIDPGLDMIYMGTGNPSPDLDGSVRPGDNLYTDSIVALNAANGTLAWYYQEVPHDVWGLDQASPPLLFDVVVNGRTVPAVGAAGKTGWFYVLDRRTGARILRSQPFVRQQNLFARPTAEGVQMQPGTNGGAEWSPTSYSPQTQDVYIAGLQQPMIYSTHPVPRQPGRKWLGSTFVPVPDTPQSGTFTAINVNTGKIAWQRTMPQPMVGGSLATAGGLVFTGEANGHFDAFDAASGKLLWQYPVGPGVNAAPMAFEISGREYIAVAAGGNAAFGPPYGDTLIVFGLP